MLNSPILWMVVCSIVIIALVYKLNAEHPTERTIHVAGIKRTATIDWEKQGYLYDCTGHGRIVFVCKKDNLVVVEGDPDDRTRRLATPDEEREWARIFEVIPIMYV